jgi:PmbA protein
VKGAESIGEILGQALKAAAEAEVFQTQTEETPVRFETNRLKQVMSRQGVGTALRLVKDGRTGFATISGQDGAGEMVSMALETAPFGAPARFTLPARMEYPGVEVLDPGVEKVTVEEMMGLGQGLIDRLRAHTPEIVCEGAVVKVVAEVRLVNSRGGEVSFRKSLFVLSMEGVVTRDTDMLFVGDSEASCRPIRDNETVARSIIAQLEHARRRASVSSGRLPVIFTPRCVAGALMMPLAMGFNGKIVMQGASPLGKKLGEKVFSDQVSLYEDATIPFAARSRPCDDEGVPSQRNVLIDRGVVGCFLYDLQTAALAGTRSTGNGSRATGGLPVTQPSSLVIGEGKTSFEDMVKDMREGLIVEELMGAEQGNVLGGDFSGNVLLGYKVEGGEIVGRVKDTMVSGNIYEALRDIVAVGQRSRWVGGMLKTPPLYLPRLSVVSKG